MTKLLRSALNGVRCFHVICRGNNKQSVFRDERDFARYVQLIKRYKSKYDLKLYAFALMTNHVHMLVEVVKDGDLSKFMQRISLAYYSWHKNKYNYSGHLWQGRFKSNPVEDEDYLLQCARYIELNPVTSQIVPEPSHYNWSSYNVLGFGKKSVIIDEHPLYLELGKSPEERRKSYRGLVLNGGGS